MAVRDFTLIPCFPSQLGLFVQPSPSGRPNVARLLRARDVHVAVPNLLVALDGSQWESTATLGALYHDEAAGIDVAGVWPVTQGCTLAIFGNEAVMLDDKQRPAYASVAVSLYPEMVRQGRNVHTRGINEDINWRAATGILASGELFFAIARAGMTAFADAMIAAGAVEAGYTDGGGSTSMLLSDGTRLGSPEDRPVPSWLVIRPPPFLTSALAATVGVSLLAAGAAVLGRHGLPALPRNLF